MKKQSTQDTSFEGVVRNALDLLQKSIKVFDKDPKQSVIFFYSSVELILKAKLLKVHWSLIFEDPKDANHTNFTKGKFKSVGFDECAKRLLHIANIKVREANNECFKILREHRNRLIHFYHAGYIEPISQETLEEVISEQCRAWVHVYDWLTKDWKNDFSQFNQEIFLIHHGIRSRQQFLQARYERCKPNIEKAIKRGLVVETCTSCSFDAAIQHNITSINGWYQSIGEFKEAHILKTVCLVCQHKNSGLRLPCPKCSTPLLVSEGNEETCEADECDETLDLAKLLEMFQEQPSPGDYVGENINIYCSDCWLESIVTINDGRYVCLNCFEIFDEDDLSCCEWCNTRQTGELNTSYWRGCNICDGKGFENG